MLLCQQATAQSSTTSMAVNDTCFTGDQVKEIYKIILEYENCKTVMQIKDSNIIDLNKIIVLHQNTEAILKDELKITKKKLSRQRFYTKLSCGVGVLVAIIAIVK